MSAPTCPRCGSGMRLKRARRGRNAGGRFWSCTTFPRCRGTRDFNAATDAVETEPTSRRPADSTPVQNAAVSGLQPRVDWSDGVLDDRWERRYTIGGGSLRTVDLERLLGSTHSHTWLTRIQQLFLAIRIEPDSLPVPNAERTQVVGTVRKILQRGDHPPLDPAAEQKLLLHSGCKDLRESPDPGDLSLESGPETTLPSTAEIKSALARTSDLFELDPRYEFDSDEERQFVDWVSRSLGASVCRWLYPQAPLDTLLQAHGRKSTGQRRIDFLFSSTLR